MKTPELLRSTALRIALTHLAVYSAVLAVLGGVVGLWGYLAVDGELLDELESQRDAAIASYRSGGVDTLAAEMRRQADASDADEPTIWLLAAAGDERIAGDLSAWPRESDIDLDGSAHAVWIDEEFFAPGLFEDDARLPVAASALGDGRRLLIARGVDQAGALVELAEFLLEGLLAAVVLSLAVAISFSHSFARRMQGIDQTAAEIMAGDLSRRMPVSARGDEFDRLSARLNEMLDRIQQLVRGIREVTDNIAHDLRSPLTRLRNRLEIAALGDPAERECTEALRASIDDADELIKTFNALLSIAQAEAGNHRCEWAEFDLVALCHDLAELYAGAAEGKSITLDCDADASAPFVGSRSLLAQAIGNLLENAIKYTPAGGRITLSLEPGSVHTVIRVADTGPGIAAADHARVVERFVRLESSRHTPGNGLGLSLVKAVAELHKGRLDLADAAPGLVASIHLPRPGVTAATPA